MAQEVEWGMAGDRKVAGSIPRSSYLSVEVSLTVNLRGRLRRRCVNVCVNG